MKNPDAEAVAQARGIILDHFTMVWNSVVSDDTCSVTLSMLLLALVGWDPEDLATAFSDRVALRRDRA